MGCMVTIAECVHRELITVFMILFRLRLLVGGDGWSRGHQLVTAEGDTVEVRHFDWIISMLRLYNLFILI